MMFELAKVNATGINFSIDGSSTCYYSPFTYNSSLVVSPNNVLVTPIYYGALFFARAAQNKGKIITNTVTNTSGSPNLKVWSVYDQYNVLRIVVINRGSSITASDSTTISISLPAFKNTTGYLYKLTGDNSPSVQSTDVSLAGQKVNLNSGYLTGVATPANINPVSGNYTFYIKAGTAAMLEIANPICNCN